MSVCTSVHVYMNKDRVITVTSLQLEIVPTVITMYINLSLNFSNSVHHAVMDPMIGLDSGVIKVRLGPRFGCAFLLSFLFGC